MAGLLDVKSLVSDVDLIDVVRSAFLAATIAVIFIYLTPAFGNHYLAYGARATKQRSQPSKKDNEQQHPGLLDTLQSLQVPHAWFNSFYILSVSLSVFWLITFAFFRNHLELLQPYVKATGSSTPFDRQLLASLLLLVQGSRRLVETTIFQSSPGSQMFIGHWIMGLAFYAGMSVAIWVEGFHDLMNHQFTIRDIEIKAPSLRSFISLLIFTFASGIQHDCHAYLATLKSAKAGSGKQDSKTKYKVPAHPAFSLTLTPHYLMECLIYLSLTILAAPEGQWLNMTLLTATTFVLVNLGITAIGTRDWYRQVFGPEAVKGKYAMIPFLL